MSLTKMSKNDNTFNDCGLPIPVSVYNLADEKQCEILNYIKSHYLLKNVDSTYWEQVELNANALFKLLKNYESSYPIEHHIQSWTAGMWAELWTYWKRGNQTRVHKTLDFSFDY